MSEENSLSLLFYSCLPTPEPIVKIRHFSKQIQNLVNLGHYNFITNALYLGGTQIYQLKTKFTMKGKHVFEITAQHVNGQVKNTISASCK